MPSNSPKYCVAASMHLPHLPSDLAKLSREALQAKYETLDELFHDTVITHDEENAEHQREIQGLEEAYRDAITSRETTEQYTKVVENANEGLEETLQRERSLHARQVEGLKKQFKDDMDEEKTNFDDMEQRMMEENKMLREQQLAHVAEFKKLKWATISKVGLAIQAEESWQSLRQHNSPPAGRATTSLSSVSRSDMND